MLIKPDFPDEKIMACLQAEYGLHIVEIAFLPLGGDLSTAVYRAVAEEGTAYFCKLKRGVFDETTVELPNYLSKQGITQIIAPVATRTGELRAGLEEFKLIVYPFVEGRSGFEVELSERQWADFGAALKRIHTTPVPAALIPGIRTDSYSPEWRDGCGKIMAGLEDQRRDDPVTTEAVAFLRSKREQILDFVGRAERLAGTMAARQNELVLCHSDIHPGNLFVDTQGALFIVDWDYPRLAAKERDLMFIGGGQGFPGVSAEQEESRFYKGYGPGQIDPVAMAYHRYERCVTDIVVEGERIFSSTLGDQDRAQSLLYLTWGFLPESSMERAEKTVERKACEPLSTAVVECV